MSVDYYPPEIEIDYEVDAVWRSVERIREVAKVYPGEVSQRHYLLAEAADKLNELLAKIGRGRHDTL